MSKKLLVAAVVAILTFGATMAMATESRIENLGAQGLYLMDDTNIFTNPATEAYYAKVLRLHMGGMGSYYGIDADMWAYGGGTMALGEAITFGVFFARNPGFEMGGIGRVIGDAVDGGFFYPYFTYDPDGVPNSGDEVPFANNAVIDWMNPFDVILAYKMGDFALGISYYLANGKIDAKDDLADNEYVARSFLHSLKIGMSLKMGNMKPEAWFHWDPFSMKTKYTSDHDTPFGSLTENLTGNKFQLGARLFYNMNDNLAIVPAIVWENVSAKLKMDSDDPDIGLDNLGQGYKYNSIETGVSAQYKADKLFLVGSLGLRWSKFDLNLDMDHSKFEDNYSDRLFAVPVAAMGLEYQATKLITFRGGINTTAVWAAEKLAEDAKDDSGAKLVDNSELVTEQQTVASIGCGLNFGNLIIDATFGNFVLVGENGGVIGSGPNMFSALDAKYVF